MQTRGRKEQGDEESFGCASQPRHNVAPHLVGQHGEGCAE